MCIFSSAQRQVNVQKEVSLQKIIENTRSKSILQILSSRIRKIQENIPAKKFIIFALKLIKLFVALMMKDP